jgi:hypothetical protein
MVRHGITANFRELVAAHHIADLQSTGCSHGTPAARLRLKP